MGRRPRNYAAAAGLARERDSQAALMARKRALGRDLEIPPIANLRRRTRCQRDPALFLKTYFPAIFYNPFTPNHRKIIEAFVHCLRYGGWKALVEARGGGKTKIAIGLTVYGICYGLKHWFVVGAATGTHAGRILKNIKLSFETSDLLLADFPEICVPIRALAGAPQRAGGQTVNGVPTRIQWTGDMLIFPTVEGSAASGCIVTCFGLDAAVRGQQHQELRPEFFILDDIETRESAHSEQQVSDREDIILKDVIGLAGQDGEIAGIYLGTLITDFCVAARFTDRTIHPAWDGSRYKFLEQKPDRMDLWDRYMEMRQMAQFSGDKHARTAHAFYLANRTAMDAGAIVTNPYRFNHQTLPDGSPVEVSALQFCFNKITDTSWDDFNAEYNAAPPAASTTGDPIDLDRAAVQQRCGGMARGLVPHDDDYLVAGVDCGARNLYWTVWSFRRGAGRCIDYGAELVHSPVGVNLTDGDAETAQAVEAAIVNALSGLAEKFDQGWPDAETGELRFLTRGGIDTGYKKDAVYSFIKSRGDDVWLPIKGCGTQTRQERFTQPAKRGHGRRVGDGWFAKRQPVDKLFLYSLDADRWKKVIHAGFLTGADATADTYGALWLWGSDPVEHRGFAQQITAEEWRSEYITGKGLHEYWKQVRHDNHWLDATYIARAIASERGMPSVSPDVAAAAAARAAAAPAAKAAPPKRRLSLSQLQALKRQQRNR